MLTILEKLFYLPKVTLTLAALLLVGGIFSYINIPKEAEPDIDIPILYVLIIQKGISPEDARRLLVKPVEAKLRALTGLKEIRSTAAEGYAGILLEFDVDFDKDGALADARAKLDQVALPEGSESQIIEINLSNRPSITVILSGDVPRRTLYRKAFLLRDEIESISNVLEANVIGEREEVLEAIIDKSYLDSYKISYEEILRAISSRNAFIPAGTLQNDEQNVQIKVESLISSVEDARNIPIKKVGDSVVKLGQLVDFRRTFKEPQILSRFNGQETVSIQVVKRAGDNILEHSRQVRQVVTNFSKEWPDSVKIDFISDSAEAIFGVLSSLQASFMTALVVVMLIVIGSLGLIPSLLTGASIISSFMIGFLIINLFGMSVNMMVMFGLVLTVGMLVDSSIIVTEYAERKITAGFPRKKAYLLSMQRMTLPLLASTATTLAAFFPMLFWPGVPGKFMSYLPIIVIVVLIVAFLVAILFLPIVGGLCNTVTLASLLTFCLLALGSKLYLSNDIFLCALCIASAFAVFLLSLYNREYFDTILLNSFREDKKKLPLSSEDDKFSQINLRSIKGLTSHYVRALAFFIKRPISTFTIFLAISVSVIILFINNPPQVDFFITEELEQAKIFVFAPGNIPLSRAGKLAEDMEVKIRSVDGIKNVFSKAGTALSRGRSGSRGEEANKIALFFVEFEDYCCRRDAEEILSEIREELKPFVGFRVEIRGLKKGPISSKAIQLDISGQNYRETAHAARRVGDYFAQMNGLRDVNFSASSKNIEWLIKLVSEKANRFNANTATVGTMAQLVTRGILIGEYRPEDAQEEVEIRLRLPRDQRSLDQIGRLLIPTKTGGTPLANFITYDVQKAVKNIDQKNGKVILTVDANVEDGTSRTDKMKEISSWIRSNSWPDGLSFHFSGSDEEKNESAAFLVKALFAALSLITLILITQFNSFYQAFITILTVILATIGVLIGILITGQNFSIIMTGTGIIALAGIVVNNAIILIDTYNRMRDLCPQSPVEMALSSASRRLRPILMTTATTVIGLIPMALQTSFDFFSHEIIINSVRSAWWVQFSTAVIFGLLFSAFLSLFFVPTMLAAPSVLKAQFRQFRAHGNRY